MSDTYQVVCRVEPVKNTLALSGVEKHENRIGTANKASHDPSRTHLNQTLVGGGSLYEDTMEIVHKYPKAHPNSAIAAEMILTANHEWFDKISPDWRKGIYTKEFEQWRDLSLKYLRDTYPGLAHASLHMDEQAPHIHAVIVPIHTKTIKFRRGEKEVTRIRYNDVFGDDMQVIVAARKANDSELTKLGRIQTAYANAMKPTGLKRGIANKKVYHQTIQEYQQLIATPSTPLKPLDRLPEPSQADRIKEGMGFATDHSRKVEEIKAENANKNKENRAVIKQMEAKSKDYDRLKTENEAMKKALIDKDEKLQKMGVELRASADAKEIAARLRGLDVAEVAARIGIEATKADRNAIDLLKNHAGFTYEQSIAWLYNEYDKRTAGYEAAKHGLNITGSITSVKPEQPLAPIDQATRAQVTRQLDALDAGRYRITLQVADEKATPDLHTYNYGKGKGPDGSEQFYSKDEITAVIPFLRRENTRGYNVFVTPFDDNKLYLLVDDLTNETLPLFNAQGYKPNLLQTTSKLKMQAVFALPKQEVSEPARNALFNELNKSYGDEKITGYTHGFRLAGFTNAKPKHRDEKGLRPIVRVLHTVKETCSIAVEWCRNFMAVTNLPRKSQAQAEKDASQLYQSLDAVWTNDLPNPTQAASKEATRFYAWIAERYGVTADYSRADFMLVERMTDRFTPSDIASALVSHSPGIEDRHKDVMRYVNATVSSGYKPS